MKIPVFATLFALVPCAARAQETIGPFEIRAAPVAAVQIGSSPWSWITVSGQPATIHEAFSGFPMADDGFANGQAGTTVEVVFAPGNLSNAPGDDLVLLDAQFSVNDYALSTSHDGFVAEVLLLGANMVRTGVTKFYFYGGAGPYEAQVFGAPVDLTDLGLPAGKSVERVRFRALSIEVDPLGVGSLSMPQLQTYCTAKPNSLGCATTLSAFGLSSASASTGFTIVAESVLNQKLGVLLYSVTGRAAIPFQGGVLCVAPPVLRTPPRLSGGHLPQALDCSGAYRIDMNEFAAGAAGGHPHPLLRQAGSYVHCQWWSRDPGYAPPNASALTAAMQYVVGP